MGKQDRTPAAGRDKGGATITTRERKDRTNSMLHRLSMQARPHYILAGMAAGGTVAGWIGPAVTDPATAGLTVAAAGTVGAMMAWKRAGIRGLLTGLGAACWCGWTAATGMSWDALATLAAGGYAAALPWWRRHRLPDPPEHQPPTEDVDELHPVRLWDRYLAGNGGPLPDTYLSGEEHVTTKTSELWRYDLHLVPGKQTLSMARGKVDLIKSGLRLRPDQDVVIEQHPEPDRDVTTARLTIVRRSAVISTAQQWPGPSYNPDTGRIGVGPYVDGEGTAEWRVHTPDRFWGGFLVGVTGSGKSRLTEAIVLGYAASGAVVWYGDPQGGASSSFLSKHADWVATDLDSIEEMLAAAMRVRDLRQVDNAQREVDGWNPGDYPGLIIVIDECHEVMKIKAAQEMATILARSGGKVGIALLMMSQEPSMAAFGGGQTGSNHRALRSSVTAGNLVALRTGEKTDADLLSGLSGVEPHLFPSVPGYAYLVDNDGTRRSAPFRAYYLPDEVRDWAGEQVTWAELEPDAATVAGPAYQRRRETITGEARQAALAEKRAMLLGGVPPQRMVAPAPAAAAPDPSGWQVPTYPTWPAVESTPTRVAVLDRPTTAPAPPPKAADVVAGLLAEGLTSPKQMVERSGYSDKAVRDALAELVATGRAVKVRHGIYQLADTSNE